jgi:transcriptional repressor NF-X1
LGGRTFPTAPAGNDKSVTESSSSQRNAPRNAQRPQPKKFVHTVEEDRDLLAALTTGLSNSTYDCMVCWDVIRPAHKIWNCQVCWAAFHLDCLCTWATKSSEGMVISLMHSFMDKVLRDGSITSLFTLASLLH